MSVNRLIVLMLLLCLLGQTTAFAAPAYNRPRRVVQPDGSVLTLVGRGDEFCHFLTTTDGYSVVKDTKGVYRYANLEKGILVPSAVQAFDVADRVVSEQKYLASKQKFLAPAMNPTAKSLQQFGRSLNTATTRRNLRRIAGQKKAYRGLVILANFTDRKFSRGNSAPLFYNGLMNETNLSFDFDEYYGTQTYTGSVKDYFSDNSYGQFAPEFDVVGPINLDVSQYYIKGVTNTYLLMEKVLKQADSEVDYSQYDSDGDGAIDMVYVIYAGYSSNYSGNDERLVWPHAGSMIDEAAATSKKPLVLDGLRAGRFACSGEIFGWEEDGDKVLDGIGVIVHEFSHVLGFMDHYDTSNGYQEHPNAWDVMSAGNYSEDFNRTPVAYNSFEKYAAGFIQPLNITEMDGTSVSLKSTEKSNDACYLHSYQDNVYYMMENRQHDKWDKYLPGHGLLVWRIDSTNADYWKANALNVTTRACFRLVRACGTQGSFLTGVEDTDYDSFPGTHKITELDNDDDAANLLSYDGYPCPAVLRNIKESNRVITFTVARDELARNQRITYELPDKFTAHAERLEGDKWVPESWIVYTRTEGDKHIIQNLVPNKPGITSSTKDYSNGVFVNFSYNSDRAHVITINSQRVAQGSGYNTWLCDLNNVYNSGAGSMMLTVDRYGIPCFEDAATQLSYVTMKSTAYVVTQKSLVDELVVYRNITFSDFDKSVQDEADAINSVSQSPQDANVLKYIKNNRVVIKKDGWQYDVQGTKYE